MVDYDYPANKEFMKKFYFGLIIGIGISIPIALNLAPNKTTKEETDKMWNLAEYSFIKGYELSEIDRNNGFPYSNETLNKRKSEYLLFLRFNNPKFLTKYSFTYRKE